MHKEEQYTTVLTRIRSLIEGERDLVSVMSTIACELHHGLAYTSWTGFYRVTAPGFLKVGPYQGGHGCLTIPFERGVCGKCAREGRTQIVPDVRKLPYHIACSTTTQSEIVIPVFDLKGCVRAVLDLDSDELNAFDEVDERLLNVVCRLLSPLYQEGTQVR